MKIVPQCVSTEFQRHNKYWYQFVKTEKAHFPGNLYHYVHMTIALLWWIYGGILFWIDKKNSWGKWRFLQALRKHKITRNWCSSHNAHCRRHWYFSSIYFLQPVTREVCIAFHCKRHLNGAGRILKTHKFPARFLEYVSLFVVLLFGCQLWKLSSICASAV